MSGKRDTSSREPASPTEEPKKARVDESPYDLSVQEVPLHKSSKERRVEFERLYIANLPTSEGYERSYMHREYIVKVVCAAKSDFIVTGSIDGAIKFWKKQPTGIEFVKHFRAHSGRLHDMACDVSDKLLVSVANDKTMKVFDIVNFDMINMVKLKYIPSNCVWIHSLKDAVQAIAITDSESPKIFIYDSSGGSKPIKILDKLHLAPVTAIKYNPVFCTVVSADKLGIVEYWSSVKYDFRFPDKDRISFDSKLDTDLFEFAKNKSIVHDIAFSPNGMLFATVSSDRKIRIFKFKTGILIRMYDETLQHCSAIQQSKQIVPNMEFGRRMAIERELEKSDHLQSETILFDQSGYFLFYPTMFGIKLVNWYTNKCIKIIGKGENLRPVCISLYQNVNPNKSNASLSIEMLAAENPNLEQTVSDPSLFTTAYKKNRFYIFTQRNPEDAGEETIIERDIFNEKPTKEDILAATEANSVSKKLYETCILHTSSGDIHIKLFPQECPKTVENFCVHAKNNYYNGHIFHRVIKQFMIQTGDPTGTGSGGESIWGHDFEDEFHANLRHDKPYTVSMANAGPNTNGSQFFITVVPCPWLDNKHTIFGRVTKGMEVAQSISNVRTNPKTDKPYDEIKIVSISLK